MKENYKCNRMSARTVLYNKQLYSNQLHNIVGYLYSFRALSVQELIQLDNKCSYSLYATDTGCLELESAQDLTYLYLPCEKKAGFFFHFNVHEMCLF